MGNVIPWSQIHPSIKSEEPFVAVVIVDPQRQLCVSEMVELEAETLEVASSGAGVALAAAQAAAARMAAGYRQQRQAEPQALTAQSQPQLRLLDGGIRKPRYSAGRAAGGGEGA